MFHDLHLHLVPGVDDGAEDLEAALRMARALVARGWAGGAVTPHIRPGMFDNEPGGLRDAITGLRSALDAHEIAFAPVPGAEHFLDAELIPRILEGDCVPLGGEGRHVLVEAPALAPVPSLADLVFRLRLKGVTPVFAHPERCAVFQDLAVARQAVEAGAVLQLDLGSLGGAYGRPARRTARRLLAEGLYAVAGTDLHNPDQAERELDGWLKALVKAAGPEGRDRLLGDNPRRLLAGEALA
jgi:protein-tyrosine phosphatase